MVRAVEEEEPEIVSYQVLRRVVGLLGMLLPIVLLAGGCLFDGGMQETISHYYETGMRDVFVGVLFVIGWFLYTYHGYDDRDNIVGNVACVCALGVALFPTGSPVSAISTLHYVSAVGLFSMLAYFSLGLFTMTKEGVPPTEEKLKRNRVYRWCGKIILLAMAGIAVLQLVLNGTFLPELRLVFWLESLALWAFGLSWFVKSEAVLRDRQVPGWRKVGEL